MGISIWQLLIVLAIVAMIFGTKKLRTMGRDVGSTVKDIRKELDEKNNKKNQDK